MLVTYFWPTSGRRQHLPGKRNVTVPGSLWWIRQERTTCSHVDLVAPVIMPEDLCGFVQQTFTGHGIAQRQIHCRPVRMRRPGAGIVLVEGRRIYDELSCTFPVFLVAATWILLFRFCVVEVPQPLLAGNRTMTVEHEQLGLVRAQ